MSIDLAQEQSKYQILLELGHGGMGVVSLAASHGPRGFTKLVVLKSLAESVRADDEIREMFLEEARVLARFTHPNIVQVFEVLGPDAAPVMVMEYLDGQSFWDVQKQGPLPLRLSLYVLTKVLAGLDAAHEMEAYDGTALNLVHRDATPHNIILLYDGQIKLLDFGIVKADDSDVITSSGQLKGKLRYMAPEQAFALSIDRRADIFSVGVMLWEALCKERMWAGKSDSDVLVSLASQDVPALPEHVKDEFPELASLCERAIAAEPTQRIANAADFQAALAANLAATEQAGSPPVVEELVQHLAEAFRSKRQARKLLLEEHLGASWRPRAHSSQPSPNTNNEQTLLQAPSQRGGQHTPRSHVKTLLLSAALTLTAVWLWRSVSEQPAEQPPPSADTAPALCGPGTKLCGGQCVSNQRPDYGCQSHSCDACDVGNATARCDGSGQCAVAMCYRHYENCDGKSENGCEIHLLTAPDHCGRCGRRCPELPHAERGCGDDCTIFRCQDGFRDCNQNGADGCEVEIASNTTNCGSCGTSCSAGQSCQAGRCQP